jgi:MFS family permease
MGMKLASQPLLRRFGYRAVLSVNTVLMGLTIGLFAAVDSATAMPWIVALSLAQGFFNSLQFASMNSMAYADIEGRDSSMASTISSSLQQLSMSFGLACATLLAGWFLGGLPQSDQAAVTGALHQAFLTLGAVTVLSSLSFWTLRPGDGDSVSRGSASAPAR